MSAILASRKMQARSNRGWRMANNTAHHPIRGSKRPLRRSPRRDCQVVRPRLARTPHEEPNGIDRSFRIRVKRNAVLLPIVGSAHGLATLQGRKGQRGARAVLPHPQCYGNGNFCRLDPSRSSTPRPRTGGDSIMRAGGSSKPQLAIQIRLRRRLLRYARICLTTLP